MQCNISFCAYLYFPVGHKRHLIIIIHKHNLSISKAIKVIKVIPLMMSCEALDSRIRLLTRILQRTIPLALINLFNKIKKNQPKLISLICLNSRYLVEARKLAIQLLRHHHHHLKHKATNLTFSVTLNKNTIQTVTKTIIHYPNSKLKLM